MNCFKLYDKIGTKKSGLLEELRNAVTIFCICFAIMFGSILLLRQFVFTSVVVQMTSMKNTLQSGDVLTVSKLEKAERGDIIVFADATVDADGKITYKFDENGNKLYLVKRLIGDSGDTVYWKDSVVSVLYSGDEQPTTLVEDYVSTEMLEDDFNTKGVFVPEGYMFVMGDNRKWSSDSRAFGVVDKRLILGVVTDFVVERKDNVFWQYVFKIF